MRDQLFLMETPFINDRGGPFYCPDCIAIEGMLHLFPGLSELVDVVRVNYQRPRPIMIETLGEEHQSIPALVLSEDSRRWLDRMANEPGGPNVTEMAWSVNGQVFFDSEQHIRRYLSRRYNLPSDSRDR